MTEEKNFAEILREKSSKIDISILKNLCERWAEMGGTSFRHYFPKEHHKGYSTNLRRELLNLGLCVTAVYRVYLSESNDYLEYVDISWEFPQDKDKE